MFQVWFGDKRLVRVTDLRGFSDTFISIGDSMDGDRNCIPIEEESWMVTHLLLPASPRYLDGDRWDKTGCVQIKINK